MGSATLVSKFTKLKVDIPKSIVDDFVVLTKRKLKWNLRVVSLMVKN